MADKPHRKHVSKRSAIWNHFMEMKIGSSRYACCLHCNNGRYLMNGSCPSGNMIYHLKAAHPTIYGTLQITNRSKIVDNQPQMILNEKTGELQINSLTDAFFKIPKPAVLETATASHTATTQNSNFLKICVGASVGLSGCGTQFCYCSACFPFGVAGCLFSDILYNAVCRRTRLRTKNKNMNRHSLIWNYFVDDEEDKSKAMSVICSAKISRGGRSCSTSNLRSHLRRHPSYLKELQDKKELQMSDLLTITNQMNSDGIIQPRTVVQLQTLWKNLTCRAKNKLNESRSDSLLGLSQTMDDGEIAPMDARVLNILEDIGTSSVGSSGGNVLERFGDEPSTSKTNASDDSVDWTAGLGAIQAIKSEILDEYDVDRRPSPVELPQAIPVTETPLPVEKNASAPEPRQGDDHASELNFESDFLAKQNVAEARKLYMELLTEKRAHLSLKRLKIEAKLKQVDLKNRALETAIEANLAKRAKFEEEAKNLHLQNLKLMRTLKCNGFPSATVEQIFPPFV